MLEILAPKFCFQFLGWTIQYILSYRPNMNNTLVLRIKLFRLSHLFTLFLTPSFRLLILIFLFHVNIIIVFRLIFIMGYKVFILFVFIVFITLSSFLITFLFSVMNYYSSRFFTFIVIHVVFGIGNGFYRDLS